MRMLVYNGNIIQLFVRVPAPDYYISSYASGGKILHYDIQQVPGRCREVALRIDERLNHHIPRLYSIDVGIGRSGKVWLYELNTMPGIVWEEENAADKTKYMHVHRKITEMLASYPG